jgi:uncharacterized protein (UPF0335 family)
MTEYRQNSYDDDDMRAVIDAIESLEAQKKSIMAAAMGECAGIANKIKVQKKQAKDDLGIPMKVLNPILKRRSLERKIEELTSNVDEDYIEVFEDAVGQFCFFSMVNDEDHLADDPDETPPSHDPTAAELAEGEEVLSQVKH